MYRRHRQELSECSLFWPHLSLFQDSSLRCWDLVTSRSVVLSGHLGAVSDFCFCGSGLNTLVSVGRDRVVGVWDLRTNTNVAFSPLFEELEAVATLPQGVLGISDPDTVVMGGTTGVLRVFSASSRKVLQERHDEGGLKFSVAQLAFSNAQDGNHLIVVTRDQNLLILEPSTLVRRQQVVGDLDEVVDVSVIGQDCQRMAVATNSADIKIWNVATNDWELLAGHTATVLSIDVSANQSRLCSSGKDSVVRVWDISKTPAKMLCSLEGHTDSVNTVAWGGNAFVVSAGKDRTLKLWKLHDKADGTAEAAHVYTCVGHAAEVNCVDVSPNERFIASGSSDKKILLWKLTKPLTAAPTLQLRMTGHKRGIWDVRFSPVDKLLASVSGDRSVRIWSVTSGACLRVLEGHLAATLRVSWMTAGTQLVSSGGDGLVKIWNAVDGECLATLQREGEDVDSTGDDGKLWALDVRRDGEVLVVGSSDSTLCIWHDRTQETAAERLAAEQEERAQRQELDSLVAAGQLARAFALALRLDQRSRGRQIAELLVREGQLQTALKQLTAEETSRLVQLCCDWNRNASLSSLAQACMATLLRIHSLEKLSASPAVRSALNAWLAFSYRHRDRLRGLAVRSHIIDHCLDLVAGAELVEASLLDDDDDYDDNNDEAVSASKNKRLRDEEDGEETKV